MHGRSQSSAGSAHLEARETIEEGGVLRPRAVWMLEGEPASVPIALEHARRETKSAEPVGRKAVRYDVWAPAEA